MQMKIQSMALKWLEEAGVRHGQTREEKEAALTELVVARLMTAYLHFHYKCGVVHDDMHTGNALLTDDGGKVKVIDWELAKVNLLCTDAEHAFMLVSS